MILRQLRLFLADWRTGLKVRPLWTLCALGGIALVEVLGRRTTSDLADLAFLSFAAFFLSCVAAADKRRRVPWWGGVKAVMDRLWTPFRGIHTVVEGIGADLRGAPRYPAGWPRLLVATPAALLVACGAFALLGTHLPGGLRWIGLRTSFALYLAVLGTLWTLHGAALVATSWALVNLAKDFARSGHPGPDLPPPAWRRLAARAYVVLVVGAAVFAPVPFAFLAMVVALALAGGFALLPGRPAFDLIWRRDDDAPVRRIPWEAFLFLQLALVTLFTLAVTLASRGSDLWGVAHPIAEMPVTHLIGRLTAWAGAGGSLAIAGFCVHVSFLARRRNTEELVPPALYLDGDPAPADVAAVRASPALEGWTVRSGPGRRRRGDVRMQLVAEADPFDPGNRLGLAELHGADTARRLLRRHQVTQRRYLLRALERLLKYARRFEWKRGTGFLVIPHVWYVLGLHRDREEDDGEEPDDPESSALDDRIGPRFDRLLPRSARHHAFVVFRALDLDAVFLEDGVQWPRFKLVLKRMFEVYDRHDGAERAEGRHFGGIPRTRVVIQEIAPESPFELKGYPEPQYRSLGRARVLHVFKDRGGDEELSPSDAPSELVPLLA